MHLAYVGILPSARMSLNSPLSIICQSTWNVDLLEKCFHWLNMFSDSSNFNLPTNLQFSNDIYTWWCKAQVINSDIARAAGKSPPVVLPQFFPQAALVVELLPVPDTGLSQVVHEGKPSQAPSQEPFQEPWQELSQAVLHMLAQDLDHVALGKSAGLEGRYCHTSGHLGEEPTSRRQRESLKTDSPELPQLQSQRTEQVFKIVQWHLF